MSHRQADQGGARAISGGGVHYHHDGHRRRRDARTRRADEDRRGGFEHGGWVAPVFDNEGGASLTEVYQRADAFLFGRRTYEIFAGSWGAMADMANSPIGVALNTRPKYVASTTLTEPRWANTTVLSGDLAAAIADLKARRGGELQVHGSP
jgi:dihydrofolate reductase